VEISLQNLHKNKKPLTYMLGFKNWWRRRESNPRPKTFRSGTYMLIPSFIVSRRGSDGGKASALASLLRVSLTACKRGQRASLH
jgi:hypothetical protein